MTSRDASAGPSMTIEIPPITIPSVTVVQAPPALITQHNAAHVGMTGPELLRVLRAMRVDPRFREAVIARGKSFRAASPEAILAYLRSVPPAAANEADGDDLLRELGYERAPRDPGATTRARLARGTRASVTLPPPSVTLSSRPHRPIGRADF